jgi:hypothetical protein
MPAEWRPVHDHGLRGRPGSVAGIMAGAESAHHERGWDNTPAMMYRIALSPYAADGMFDLSAWTVFECDDLRLYADALEATPPAHRNALEPGGAPVAHVFIAEGYRAGYPMAEPPDRALADLPGSIETRFAIGVVEGERVLYLRRDRGRAPEIMDTPMTDGPVDRLGGELVFPHLVRVHRAARRLHGLAT